MDLKRFFGILHRHKLLIIGGTLLAAVAAVLAYTKLAPEVWQSQSQLLITQGHDPYGAAAQPVSPNSGEAESATWRRWLPSMPHWQTATWFRGKFAESTRGPK